MPIILRLFSKARGHLLFSNYSRNNLPKPNLESYPHPSNTLSTNLIAITTTANHGVTSQQIMREFPSVFDGQIKTMEGEKFHNIISLTDDAKPFCVNAPQIVQIAISSMQSWIFCSNKASSHQSRSPLSGVRQLSSPPRKIRTISECMYTFLASTSTSGESDTNQLPPPRQSQTLLPTTQKFSPN